MKTVETKAREKRDTYNVTLVFLAYVARICMPWTLERIIMTSFLDVLFPFSALKLLCWEIKRKIAVNNSSPRSAFINLQQQSFSLYIYSSIQMFTFDIYTES